MRKFALLVSVGMVGAAVAVVPGLATATGTAVVATPSDTWSPQQSGTPDNSSVSFSNPQAGLHDVHFEDGPNGLTPSCTTPTTPTQTMWSGTCTFGSTEGAYIFICDRHGTWDPVNRVAGGMWGTVYVNAAGTVPTTTTTTTTATTTTTGTTTTTNTPPPPAGNGGTGAPGAGAPGSAAAGSLRAPAVQHGATVTGSVTVASGGSRLEADLVGSASQLARVANFGRTRKANVAAGVVRFKVSLSRSGRSVLRRRHRLALKLVVKVSGPGGASTSLSKPVTLKN